MSANLETNESLQWTVEYHLTEFTLSKKSPVLGILSQINMGVHTVIDG